MEYLLIKIQNHEINNMNSGETNKKKYKRPKNKTSATTRPETSVSNSWGSFCLCELVLRIFSHAFLYTKLLMIYDYLQKGLSSNNANELEQPEPQYPLLAKDSEWVDILQTTPTGTKGNSDAEAVLQLVIIYLLTDTY